jgi:hypothetical protein
MAADRRITIVDGSVDFSGGVNSYVTPTIQSANNPHGLQRNQLAWMDNATVRGGGITQRPAWKKKGDYPEGAVGIFQGKFTYEPDEANPYIIAAIGGHIWKLDPDNPSVGVDLSAQFGVSLPSALDRYYFAQAEQFLVIQPGDLLHLPLIWDGSILRRSLGLSGMGLEFSPTNIGSFVGQLTAGFAQPALLGSTGVVTTGGTFTLGSLVYFMSGTTWNGTTNQIITPGIVLASYQVTAATPGVNVTLQLLGYRAPYIPTFAMPSGIPLFTLTTTPTQFMPGTAEIPAAQSMDYFMGRVWYAQGRKFSAGDIVYGSSGTLPYALRDAVLKVTENPLAVGGDGFSVPTNSGNITALRHNANINTQLGQGQLYIFTRKSVYSITVPVSRFDWISASNNGTSAASTMPLMTVVLVENGSVNDRSVATQNGDLYFQSIEPGIRSVVTAVRNFNQGAGNVPISVNEHRILQFQNRALMQFCSGLSFDNRMLQTVLPFETPVGVAHKAIIPLNFDNVSTFEATLPPVWEGMYEGLDTLELCGMDFNGRQRAFATIWSEASRNIQLWEISDAERFEGGDNRVVWYVEFPAFTWGDEFQMKKLVSAEIWLDRIFGEVNFTLDYRPDGDPCWYPWNRWKLCTARDTCEDVHNPVCLYPKELGESFRQTISMPLPPNACQSIMGRPANVGFQFQCRLAIKGFCRIRGILLKAEKVQQEMYGDMVCP